MARTGFRISFCLLLVVFTTPASSQTTATQSPSSALAKSASPRGVFLVKPYLQWGRSPEAEAADTLALVWHTEDDDSAWSVEVKATPDRPWSAVRSPAQRRVAMPTIPPHRIYTAELSGLVPGTDFEYRVLDAGVNVFSASAHPRKTADQSYRFVVYGDCAAGTSAQKAVAYQTYLAQPDFVFITGDIVYSRGLISEYRERFYPVYNADEASATQGAPLIRSTVFLAAPGNHDLATADLDKYPDALAYFLYWSQPINGPLTHIGGPNSPRLAGSEPARQAFLKAAGPAFPRMANFSFNYANAHWTVLDANTYVDWTDPDLRAWLEHDLNSNRNAAWRFVGFHQPGFNSSRQHFDEQRMRLLADVFERCGVDMIFSGHVHNYQRSFPLHFVAHKNAQGELVSRSGRVDGRWTLDKVFDGRTRTRPSGVIYIITGAGGANLYNPEQQTDPASWQPFTDKFISTVHSLTVVDVAGRRLKVRQVSDEGDELDAFTITK
jgi:Calcineurin-like phosphoesterase